MGIEHAFKDWWTKGLPGPFVIHKMDLGAGPLRCIFNANRRGMLVAESALIFVPPCFSIGGIEFVVKSITHIPGERMATVNFSK